MNRSNALGTALITGASTGMPVITVPTITLEGGANGAPHPNPSAYINKFTGSPADHQRRHRAQSASGSPAGLCPRCSRRRRLCRLDPREPAGRIGTAASQHPWKVFIT